MARVRSLVAIFLFIVCAAPAFADKRCKPSDREIFVQAPQAVSGSSFLAFVELEKHETVSWEVSGGTIDSQEGNWVSVIAGDPGSLVIDASIEKGGHCELASVTVPVICVIDDRDLTVGGDPLASGKLFYAAIGVWQAYDETVEWAVRGGTIVETGQPTGIVSVIAGAPGTLEIDATITRGACTRTFTTSVQVVCMSDPTIGLFFEGGHGGGEPVHAWTNLSEGQTARWEITNGTPSTAEGAEVIATPTGTGTMIIDLYVSWYSCTEHRRSYFFNP